MLASMEVYAVKIGDLPAVIGYLARGGDPNASDLNGSKLLHIAIHNGHLDVVKELLKVPGRFKGSTLSTITAMLTY